ncbi:MAG: transglutaminase domain-containing protein [Thermodesulfobacteriota bacterium]
MTKTITLLTAALMALSAYPAHAGYGRVVTLNMSYRISSENASGITLLSLVPRTLPGRQIVRDLSYFPEPSRVFDENGNRYAEFVIDDPGGGLTVRIDASVEILGYDLSSASPIGSFNPFDDIRGSMEEESSRMELLVNEELREKYLREERFLEKNHAAIAGAATLLYGFEDLETARKTYNFVLEKLTHLAYDIRDNGAVKVLGRRTGDCNDYSDLFVALLRANEVPARFVYGLVPASDGLPYHAWAEAFLEDYGWVPFDPLFGDLGAASFERLPPVYIYLSRLRSDSLLNNGYYFTVRHQGGSVRVDPFFTID